MLKDQYCAPLIDRQGYFHLIRLERAHKKKIVFMSEIIIPHQQKVQPLTIGAN